MKIRLFGVDVRFFSLYFVLVYIFATEVRANQNTGDSNWHWTWSCNTKSGQCEKSTQPVLPYTFSRDEFVSQQVCRLICGKYGALWPAPSISTNLDNQLVYFHPSAVTFDLIDSTVDSKVFFTEIASIFKKNIVDECGGHCTLSSDTSHSVEIKITSESHDLHLLHNTDESYSLKVTTEESKTVVQITSKTPFGARHALETLSQLIASYKLPSSKREVGLVMVANAVIKDKPVFKHRGLLIDSARNYLPIHTIKKQIDAMAASKMNVLHWHATDAQSFPIVSKRVPKMAKYGAYSKNQIYHLEDISSLVEYARHRGVRIILELDAPAHAGNGWQWGPNADLGNLSVCVNQVPWRQFCIQPPCGQLNPANKNVYGVLKELYKDFTEVTERGEWCHMGGDEVFLNCWNKTEEITTYMTNKGWGRTLEDFLKLWAEYQQNSVQTYDTVVGHDKTPIILWSSKLTEPEWIEEYLPKDRYIIQTWVPTTDDMPAQLLKKGYRLIISTKNAWYLDHGFWGITQYYTWRTVYKNRIPRQDGVLGGEVCMWGEYVDKFSIDARVWPRAAAAAERLWSDPNFDITVVEARFYRHRDRLVARGIGAEALAPGWCVQNEGECL